MDAMTTIESILSILSDAKELLPLLVPFAIYLLAIKKNQKLGTQPVSKKI